jgi:hypothetical protein
MPLVCCEWPLLNGLHGDVVRPVLNSDPKPIRVGVSVISVTEAKGVSVSLGAGKEGWEEEVEVGKDDGGREDSTLSPVGAGATGEVIVVF